MSPRVLIVDDDEDIRALLKTVLTMAGYVVIGEAVHGKEGVSLAKVLQPDLILLDVLMPVLDGIAALPLIREVTNAKVVLITSLLSSNLVDDDNMLGVLDFDTPPDGIIPKTDLLRRVHVLAEVLRQ